MRGCCEGIKNNVFVSLQVYTAAHAARVRGVDLDLMHGAKGARTFAGCGSGRGRTDRAGLASSRLRPRFPMRVHVAGPAGLAATGWLDPAIQLLPKVARWKLGVQPNARYARPALTSSAAACHWVSGLRW